MRCWPGDARGGSGMGEQTPMKWVLLMIQGTPIFPQQQGEAAPCRCSYLSWDWGGQCLRWQQA